ncbi:GNAT family N-acetyltransferase [Vitiosangium sp. GDMCC 1.1324]|uniref:GNAT family N-acetyltransferase n=1 Tax=Vitiosangium sp. (strain GDMCC 1.1324) TaxID=2138576 RepID=UPI000D3D3FAA|nr:GNAT family N-acetyltransferase [Vitiosangium sp. GDMCC 1.1324]PTL75788.1 N-acetyltransferase [Vitiosangium sp. GDMCC 1.1324]
MSTEWKERLVIREARPEDDAAIGELLVEAFITQYAKKLPEVQYTEERKRQLRDVASKRAVAKVLVAELEGRVVGTVALWPPGAPGAEAWVPGAADLRHLATAVDFHGRGLSTPLLDAAERVAREWSVPAICLHVRRGAEGVARMYQRRGFVREPAGDLDTPSVYLEAYLLRFPG